MRFMSMFKRAEWSSGLTYRQTCQNCRTVITYMDNQLDFRPWYADGFIYCPGCNTPLRHSEHYAINRPITPINEQPVVNVDPNAPLAIFCSQCGNKFNENDRFCPMCGTKR